MKRICFIHIPKTGGMSVRKFISTLYPDELICPWTNEWEFEQMNSIEAKRYYAYFGHIKFCDATKYLPEDTIYVSLVREPFERLFSLFSYWKLRAHSPVYKKEREGIFPLLVRDLEFIDFLRSDIPELKGNIENFQSNFFLSKESERATFENIRPVIDNSFTYIGITNNMTDFFENIYSILEVPYVESTIMLNCSPSKSLIRENIESLKEISHLIHNSNREDYKLFFHVYNKINGI